MEQQAVGRVRYVLDGQTIAETALLAQACAEQPPQEKPFWEQVWESIRSLFQMD